MHHTRKENHPEKPLTSTMEDYLEAIFNLDRDKKVVRVKDIAKKLDVKMPSVTSMLKTLSDRGLVSYEKYEYVELTDEGSGVGEEMHRRHGILREFLTKILKVDPATADEEACKMEHALSAETLNSFTDFISFVQNCPRAGENWLRHFDDFRLHGFSPEKCVKRSERYVCESEDKRGNDSAEDSV
jgi:DtxR family transcriptional regulator, Mn-dependent transcriptional regulator